MAHDTKHRCRSRGAAAPEDDCPISMREMVQLMNGFTTDVAKTAGLERFATTLAVHEDRIAGVETTVQDVDKKVDDVREGSTR